MVTANMTPFGVTVIEELDFEFMSPGGGTVLIAGAVVIFPAQYAVPTAVALIGISP